jgi:hypothetical protein
MAHDATHALDHPEAAGYALGTLDPDDVAAFEEHRATCEQCQAEVAEFTPVARSLTLAAPAAVPPDDLELKVMAAVQYAIMAEGTGATTVSQTEAKARPTAKASRWWHLHWTNPLFAALAAAAITAVAFLGTGLFHSAPALAATIKLQAQPGFSGSGLATVRHTSGGYEISLSIKGLPVPGTGRFYECWYAGPNNRPDHPELITAGTFVVDHNGSQTLSMWSAADPAKFNIMQITLEQPGDASQHGKVILSGSAEA